MWSPALLLSKDRSATCRCFIFLQTWCDPICKKMSSARQTPRHHDKLNWLFSFASYETSFDYCTFSTVNSLGFTVFNPFCFLGTIVRPCAGTAVHEVILLSKARMMCWHSDKRSYRCVGLFVGWMRRCSDVVGRRIVTASADILLSAYCAYFALRTFCCCIGWYVWLCVFVRWLNEAMQRRG